MSFTTGLDGALTEVARLSSAGHLGVGTSAPSAVLDVERAGTAKANLDMLELTNSGTAHDMDGTVSSVLFNQFWYHSSATGVGDAARISVGSETDWTST